MKIKERLTDQQKLRLTMKKTVKGISSGRSMTPDRNLRLHKEIKSTRIIKVSKSER